MNIPPPLRAEYFSLIFAVVAFAVGTATGYLGFHDHVTRYTTVRHVPISYGKPDQSLAGTQVNPALKGLTCDVYRAKKMVVCHP